METIFKVGDKVYYWACGWGEVITINSSSEHAIGVDFDNGEHITFTFDGKYFMTDPFPTLSFTKYTVELKGFSQERPKPELPKIEEGQLVYVKIVNEWLMRYASHVEKGKLWCFNKQEKFGQLTDWKQFALKNPLEHPDTEIYTCE